MTTRCPACNTESYLLADGRRQCRQCRRKFTPGPRRGRLSRRARETVAQSFWDLVSAHQAASLAGINRKTALRIYREFRERMARENDWRINHTQEGDRKEGQNAKEWLNSESLTLLCGVGIADGAVWVVFPTDEGSTLPIDCSSCLAVGREWIGQGSFLSRVQQLPVTQSPGDDFNRAVAFWSFARKELNRYRGGFQREFHLYLKEVAFRFNNPDKSKALNILLGN